MRVFCPNCGTENAGTAGGRVTCRACTASFDVPHETSAPAPVSAPPVVQQPQRATPAPVIAPQPIAVQPPPNVWAPSPQSFAPPPTASGPTNPLAIVSLVSGIVGCLCLPGLGSIVGLITGAVALSQVNQAQGTQRGRELAIGGLVVSMLGCMSWTGYFLLAAVSR